jgi:hypothetical protein
MASRYGGFVETYWRSEHPLLQPQFVRQGSSGFQVITQQLAEFASALPGGMVRGERTLVGKIFAFSPFLPFVIPAVWSWFRIAQRVRQGRWRRPRWYARMLWTSLYTATILWLWAVLSRVEPWHQDDFCRFAGQGYDDDLYHNYAGPLPPLLLSAPCNEHYDRIPVWINPAIVICLLLTVAALGALTAAAIRRTRPGLALESPTTP